MADDDKPAINLPIQKSKATKIKAFFHNTTPYFRLFNITLMLLILSTIFLLPYPDPFQAMTPSQSPPSQGLDRKTILVPRTQYQKVFDNFNNSIEEGFCLFGKVNKTHIKIEEIKFNEDPISQGSRYITNLCLESVKEELLSMYLDYDYKLIGNVHTHPQSNEARLSLRDIHSMGKTSLFQRTWGVANNTTINFFTHDSLGMGVPVKYYKKS